MSGFKLVGIAGSFNRPSKTLALVRHVAERASIRYGFTSKTYDLNDVGPSLGSALWRKDLDAQARHVIDEIVQADALIIGSPTYKGSYPGHFKHLIDLIDPHELRGKPIVITATGGGTGRSSSVWSPRPPGPAGAPGARASSRRPSGC